MKLLLKYSNKIYKANTERNVTIVITLVLATILVLNTLMAVDSISIINEKLKRYAFGAMTEAYIPQIGIKDDKNLYKSGLFSEQEKMGILGNCSINNTEDNKLTLFASDEKTAVLSLNELIYGRWVTSEKEVVIDDILAEEYNIFLGDKVSISYYKDNKLIKGQYEVTGICQGNGYFDEKRVFILIDPAANYTLYREYLNCSSYDLAFVKEKVACDYNINILVNETDKEIIPWFLIIKCVVIIVTVICAALLIYSAYYIYLINNIKEYGQLKLVGIKNKQLSAIIWVQIIRQYLLGILVGSTVSFVIAQIVFPIILKLGYNGFAQKLIIKPSHFVICFLSILASFYIGTNKILKIIKKIPPIKTTNYCENVCENLKLIKEKKYSPWIFAVRNIRNRKESFFLITVSIAISVIIFVSTVNVIGSIDINECIGPDKYNLPADIIVGSKNIILNTESSVPLAVDEEDDIPLKIFEDIKKICDKAEVCGFFSINSSFTDDGSKEFLKKCQSFSQIHIDEIQNEDDGLNKDIMERYLDNTNSIIFMRTIFCDYDLLLKNHVFKGEIDREKFESGDYCIAVAENDKGDVVWDVGEKIKIPIGTPKYTRDLTLEEYLDSLSISKLKTREFEIMAVSNDWFTDSVKKNDYDFIDFILPSKLMDYWTDKPILGTITINTSDVDYLEKLSKNIKIYCESTKGFLDYRSKEYYCRQMNKGILFYLAVGMTLYIIFGLIALIGFINGCVGRNISRKEEYKTLFAIGMTKKQLVSFIRMENLIVVLMGAILGEIIGLSGSYYIVNMIRKWLEGQNRNIFTPSLCYWPGIVLIVLLCLLSVLYPNKKTRLGE